MSIALQECMPRLAPRLTPNCAVVTPAQAHKVRLFLVAECLLGCLYAM